MLILQEIQFPVIGDVHNDMYMRDGGKNSRLDAEEKLLFISQVGTVTFDTYFNSFSYEKWRKYTVLDSVSLRLRLRGTFEVALVQWVLGDEPERFVLRGERVCAEALTEKTFVFEPLYERGVLAFELRALSEDAVFCGGEYITDEVDLPPVNIAVCICTFRREAFVKRTVAELEDLQNGVLRDHWRCYIADNGRTLDAGAFLGERVQVLPNMNGGGSAGFARAMLAALDDQKKHGLTHCLLMDDDVVFTRHAVERAGVFARLLKDEYRGAMLGGAMLLLGKADVQEEAGARVDINVITPIKKGRCLSSLTAVLENEIEESISYSSWFFCCFSLDDSLRNNFPLPFFFQYDDIEFSLRNYERRKITLNGVCVWHESFDKKRSISKDYYYGVRNRLIMLAIHSETFFRAFSKTRLKIILLKKTAFLLLTYRYNAAELVMRAGEDFLLGIDWLGSVDPEALNREVAGAGEPFSDVSFVTGELRLSEQDARSRGFLLARKAVFFNTWTRKGYRVERSLRRMFKALGRLLRLFRAIDKSFARVVTQYRERFRSAVSEEFWRRLLGLG